MSCLAPDAKRRREILVVDHKRNRPKKREAERRSNEEELIFTSSHKMPSLRGPKKTKREISERCIMTL